MAIAVAAEFATVSQSAANLQTKPTPVKPSRDISRLIEIMAALRTPGTGCPWDLLLQVVFHARMAEEQGAFDFADVVETLTAKLIRRHPHVFADADGKTAKAVEGLWERIKAEEKVKAGKPAQSGALSGVPLALPALTRALKLQDKAGRVGFDWNDPRAVLDKIREEADEIEAELDRGQKTQQAAEVGDLLFAVVNLARHLRADPESLLRETNIKFERRFAAIERALAARGKTPLDATLAEMDTLWDAAKADEKS
jgi:nucleoside triphosphate diphosphatase